MELDRLDLAILEHLQANGRATAAELGEAVNLSASPAHRRQKILEAANVILGYVAILDQDKLGLPVNVFVTVKLASHTDETLRQFEAVVAHFPEVMEMYEMTGSTDYLLRVVAADIAAYESFLRGRLTHVPGVQAIETRMALKRVISRTSLPLRSKTTGRGGGSA